MEDNPASLTHSKEVVAIPETLFNEGVVDGVVTRFVEA